VGNAGGTRSSKVTERLVGGGWKTTWTWVERKVKHPTAFSSLPCVARANERSQPWENDEGKRQIEEGDLRGKVKAGLYLYYGRMGLEKIYINNLPMVGDKIDLLIYSWGRCNKEKGRKNGEVWFSKKDRGLTFAYTATSVLLLVGRGDRARLLNANRFHIN